MHSDITTAASGWCLLSRTGFPQALSMLTSVFSELIPYVAALDPLWIVLFWHSSKIDHYVRVTHLRRKILTFDTMCAQQRPTSFRSKRKCMQCPLCAKLKVCTVAHCGKRTTGCCIGTVKQQCPITFRLANFSQLRRSSGICANVSAQCTKALTNMRAVKRETTSPF